MENGHNDIEDDIFDLHMHEIDERKTPRWEMSEEEPDVEEEQTRLLNCNGLPKQQAQQNSIPNKKPDIVNVEKGQTWEDVSEHDSVKDFTGPYREQEAKYMERTNEAIFNRASEEHIRQPIPYDDNDSIKNFGGASQGISRIPSEEQICLSPPWPPGYEVDDGIPLEDNKGAEAVPAEGNSYCVDDMISQAKLRADARIGTTTWQESDTVDCTRNYADEGSLENSRRPSSEDISLTPPWLDTDKESSCKDVEEQVIDDNELPTADPPTTSSIPTGTSTTAHVPLPKTDPVSSVTKASLSEPSQSPRVAKRTPNNQPDPKSVLGNTSKPLPPQRHTPQGKTPDRSNVCVNPVATRSPQIKPYTEVYNNRYPSPHRPYKGNDPYYDPSNMGAVPLPFSANPPYGSLHNTRMPYPVPRSGAEYIQQSNLKSYNGMASFSPRQYRPRSQGIPSRPQINPTNSSYSNIPHPFPNGNYYNQPHPPRTGTPRQAINRYDSPYYGPRAVDWQYQVRQPQIPIQTQPPAANTTDFAAKDELINFAEESKRILPPSDRPTGVTAPDIYRSIPTSEQPEVHRNIPVSEIQRNVPDFHRVVPAFRRDITPTDSRRGIPDHQHAISDFPPDFVTRGMYPDFPDDITTVSDSDVSPVMSTRAESQSSLAVYCHTPNRDGIETASVVSFTSGASTHQDLDSKIDQVRNLLAVIDTRDAKETARTLYSLSNSKENCQAMRLSGCLPLLIQLQHKSKTRDPRIAREVHMRSAQTIRNIIEAGIEDKRGKRELRVLRLIEVVRSYCSEIRYVRNAPSSSKLVALSNALAAIMKLSFEEDHRVAIGDLGGVEAIGEFLELSYVSKDGDLSLGNNVRKYASMTLTNMTFEKTRCKALLGNSPGIVKALLKNLNALDDEDLIQVSASVLRNLSCKSDERSKMVLQECNAVSDLMTSAQKVSSEPALRTILYAVWNLSAHSSENKVEICETHKALGFLVEMLAYKSPSSSLTVVENSGGILRNLSSQIAVNSEYRATLREHECFKLLLANLRSPSLRVVGNACGILWNLSARCETDQEILLKMGALAVLKPLVTSKNKSISKGAGAAIKNLQNYKTANAGRDSPSEIRKQNGILRQENGSPSTTRTKGKSRDAHSLNSFTGSADDMTKESSKHSSRTKENGETDPNSRTKVVRWSDDKRKDPQRKTSNDRKRGEGSPDEQQQTAQTKEGVNDVTNGVGQLRIGEKSRNKKSEGSYSSPRTKKKSSSKSKKRHSGGDDVIDENLRLSQESQLNRSTSNRQGPANGRRHTPSDLQHPEPFAKHLGKVTKGKDGRRGASNCREDDPELSRSGDEGSRNSPMSARHLIRTRLDSEENDRGFNEDKGMRDLASQRCQCADESEVWVKRNKMCSHCQKRRVSHSSDSTSGSRRSSYESLSSSNRQLNRKEPLTNGTGYVTTI